MTTTPPGSGRSPLVAVAWWLGWCGLAGLVACGIVALLPADRVPTVLAEGRLTVVAMLALATSSLLGWGCVQLGQQRLRRSLGPTLGALLLAVLPLACAATTAILAAGWVPADALPRSAEIVLATRWYPPAVLAASLLAFLTWTTRPRTRIRLGRGLWFAALTVPYVVLVAVLALDVPVPWLQTARVETLDAIGGWSFAVQLALAYLVGDAAHSG